MTKRWAETTIERVAPIAKRAVEAFSGTRRYYSTGSVGPEGRVSEPEIIDYISRPSRADSMPNIGDVGFARMKGTRKVLLVDKTLHGSLFSTGFCFLSPNPDVEPRFLFYLLASDRFQRAKDVLAGKGIMGGIKNSDVSRIQIPISSLADQKRIVNLLDEAFAGLAKAQAHAEKNLRNARALLESHLQSVFTRKGDGWIDRQLDSLCREITVGHVGPMKSQYKVRGIPFLRSQNIRPFEISLDNLMYIDEDFHRSLRKSRLHPGDLAIVRTGYPGTAAVIPPELPESNCSDLVIVRPSEAVNPDFLAAFFNSTFGKRLVLGKVVGAAQKHFNITAAKEITLHVPPIAEQLRIVEAVKAFRAQTQQLEDVYQRKLRALDALKKCLLHDAFSGAL